MRSKKRRRRRRLTAKTRAIIAFFCMVFLMGLTIFLWPQIMGVHLGHQARIAISEFFEMANAGSSAEEQPPQVSMEYIPQPTPTARPYADLYKAMCEYNEEIYRNGQDDYEHQKDPGIHSGGGHGVEPGPRGPGVGGPRRALQAGAGRL